MTPDIVKTHHTFRTTAAIAAVVLLLVACIIVAQIAGPANTRFASAAAVLTVVTLVAVGIERVVEIGWTIVGQSRRFGAWWPVNEVTNRAAALEQDLNKQLAGLIQGANTILDGSGKLVENADKLVQGSDKWILEAIKQLQNIQNSAPGDQRVHLLAANAQLLLNQINSKRPELRADLDLASQTIDGLLDFVSAFKENPARRLISLYVGMCFGLIVAFVLRLDLFCAASGANQCAAQGLLLNQAALGLKALLPYWPVALTGLLIGLGSSPTHEVIKYIQESKKSQRALNGPSVVTRTEVEEAEVPPAGAAAFAPGERGVAAASRPLPRTTRTLFLR